MTPRQVALVGLVGALWGSSYLLIKYALEDLSAAEVVCGRVGVAALALWLVVRRQAQPWAEVRAELRGRAGPALGLGAVSIAVPFLLIAVGELEVPSGLTAILIAPVPLLVAALAPLLDRSERIARRQWLGLVLGLGGIGLIVGVESIATPAQFLGAVAILAACLCYAIGGFVVKRGYRGVPPLVSSTVALFAATLITLPPALATAHLTVPGLRTILAVLGLGVANTALAFVVYYRLIGELGAGGASLVTYIAPVFALGYGAIFLGEAITPAAVGGFGLVLGGVWLAARGRATAATAPEVAIRP